MTSVFPATHSEDLSERVDGPAAAPLGRLSVSASGSSPFLALIEHGELSNQLTDLARSLAQPVSAVIVSTFAAMMQRYTGRSEVTVEAVVTSPNKRPTVTTWRADIDIQTKFASLAAAACGALRHDARATASEELRGSLVVQLNMRLPERVQVRGALDGDRSVDAEMAARMVGHWKRLVEASWRDREGLVAEASLCTAPEREQLLVTWNDTAVTVPKDTVLHDLFRATAAAYPERIAVECRGEALSYGELDERAHELAGRLRAAGVGPETLVGLCVSRSFDLPVGLLGVLRAGGAFVPLEFGQSPERLHQIVEDTGLRIVVASDSMRSRLSLDPKVEVFPVAAEGETSPPPRASVRPDNLAYCIHTSGSTGRPKGVAVSHASVVNHVLYISRALELCPTDRVLQFTNPSIDACLEEVFPTWIAGATLVLHPTRAASDEGLVKQLHEDAITVLSMPTSYWHHLVDVLSDSERALPPSVRVVFVGGERALPDKLRRWRQLPSTRGTRWKQDYGPTETTISCTLFDDITEVPDHTIPIGRPIANARIYLLDSGLEPVPVGVKGDIYVAGAGLARGYLHSPRLTAERFVPNPFEDGTRMYRTGDVGRFSSDGTLEFIGRVDDQVKIRGHRVEPSEVESALRRCARVRNAAVVVRRSHEGPCLDAYVVSEGFDEGEMRIELARYLPAAMRPARLIPVLDLPLSPISGKVDRPRLAQNPPLATPALDPDTVPWGRPLAAAWEEVMGAPPGSATANFFLCGGDSLQALRLLGRISETSGVKLSYADIRAAPTFRELATRIAESSPPQLDLRAADSPTARGRTVAAKLRRRPSPRRPASGAQRRLWFLSQSQEGAATYSITLAYRLRGDLSIERLDRALCGIVSRHEALRTGLVMRDGQLWQRVDPPSSVRSQVRTAESFDEARRIAASAAAVSIDVTQAEPLRSICIRLTDDDHLWVLLVHHAVFDAWSLAVFWRELARAYESDAALPEPDFQYGDYVDWQRRWLASTEADAQRSFWRERLRGALPVVQLGAALDSPSRRSYAGDMVELNVDPLAARVSAAASDMGITEFVFLLATYIAVLHRHSRQERIVVGIVSACRSASDFEGVVGFLANTLPICVEVDPTMPFRQLALRTADAVGAALVHQDLPFDQIIDLLETPRTGETSPVFQAMFVMESTPFDTPTQLLGLEVDELPLHSGTAKFDITCSLRATKGHLQGELEYSRDVLDDRAAGRLADAYACALEHAVRETEAPLGALHLWSAKSATQAIAAANSGFEVDPDLRPLHEYIEAQVRATPTATAIESRSGQLTYRELDERANRLAWRLLELVGPRATVGVCLARSSSLVVAVLAILKAGAGFVPLGERLGRARIGAIVEDAGAHVIITEPERSYLVTDGPATVVFEEPGPWPSKPPPVRVRAGDTAYVYYTSGSTGAPKGVVIDHRCAMTRLQWLRNRYPLRAGDRVLQKCPLIFDVAIWELFGPLLEGATVLLADANAETDVRHIRELLQRPGTVFVHFVPSMLDAFLAAVEPTIYPDLRWIQVSGEAVSTQLLERAVAHFGLDLHNCYGQTETSEVCAWEGRRPSSGRSVAIGRAIGSYRVYVLDDELRPVPPGVPGEVHVAGVGGLALGYHGKPGLTAKRFVPHPYPVEPGERLFRTGDLAVASEDGNLEFRGRIDTQLKIRGCRVELGDVEAAVARAPFVLRCAAVARVDADGRLQLIAYLVGDRDHVEDIASHVELVLPTYMQPTAYVFLDALPRTPSGKLDRLSLPAPTAADFEMRSIHQAARTPLEEQLVELWKEVLRLDHVGRSDNFFAIGGNSLNLIQVLTRLSDVHNIQLSVREFFSAPTVTGLASQVERALVELIASLSAEEVANRIRAGRQ